MAVRILIGVGSVLGLLLIFLFQRTDLAGLLLDNLMPIDKFLINRGFRFLLNDFFALGLIYSVFVERKYVVFAIWTQLAGVLFFLIPYFILKIYYPTYNGPLISYLHRLILNPTLLLLLIPAFYYQRLQHGR